MSLLKSISMSLLTVFAITAMGACEFKQNRKYGTSSPAIEKCRYKPMNFVRQGSICVIMNKQEYIIQC